MSGLIATFPSKVRAERRQRVCTLHFERQCARRLLPLMKLNLHRSCRYTITVGKLQISQIALHLRAQIMPIGSMIYTFASIARLPTCSQTFPGELRDSNPISAKGEQFEVSLCLNKMRIHLRSLLPHRRHPFLHHSAPPTSSDQYHPDPELPY